jgi:hypothetical protein
MMRELSTIVTGEVRLVNFASWRSPGGGGVDVKGCWKFWNQYFLQLPKVTYFDGGSTRVRGHEVGVEVLE